MGAGPAKQLQRARTCRPIRASGDARHRFRVWFARRAASRTARSGARGPEKPGSALRCGRRTARACADRPAKMRRRRFHVVATTSDTRLQAERLTASATPTARRLGVAACRATPRRSRRRACRRRRGHERAVPGASHSPMLGSGLWQTVFRPRQAIRNAVERGDRAPAHLSRTASGAGLGAEAEGVRGRSWELPKPQSYSLCRPRQRGWPCRPEPARIGEIRRWRQVRATVPDVGRHVGAAAQRRRKAAVRRKPGPRGAGRGAAPATQAGDRAAGDPTATGPAERRVRARRSRGPRCGRARDLRG